MRPISSHLDEQTWSIKNLFYCFKRNFACGMQWVVLSGPPSCPLGQPITARDLVHLACSRSWPYNKTGILLMSPINYIIPQWCTLPSEKSWIHPCELNNMLNYVHITILPQDLLEDGYGPLMSLTFFVSFLCKTSTGRFQVP